MPKKSNSNSSSSVSLSSDHSSDISDYQKDNNKILQKSEAPIKQVQLDINPEKIL